MPPADSPEAPELADATAPLRDLHELDFTLTGFSLGGVETSVIVPEWRLAFDVGRGRDELIRCEHIALTHTHMDHTGGLAYLLALRQLQRLPPPTVYVPAQVADALRAMLDAWDPLQRHRTECTIVPIEPGDRHRIARDLYLEPFRTYHPVPSFGYSVVREVQKLRQEFSHLAGPEIAQLRRDGVEITHTEARRLLSVTGDTLPEVLDRQPHIIDSQVLLMECTFLDDNKPYQACRDGGHVHIRDLLERAELLRPERLVLSHFSRIHSERDIPELLVPLAEAITAPLYAFPVRPEGQIVGPIGRPGSPQDA
ncbi:MAG: MBL fold metallo-hydrolase [Myxococcota bacterium]